MMSKFAAVVVVILAVSSATALAIGLAPYGEAVYATALIKPTADFSDVYPRGRVAITEHGVTLLAEPVYIDVRMPRRMDSVAVCLTGSSPQLSLGIRRAGALWSYETVPYVLQKEVGEQCFQSFTLENAAVDRGRIRLFVSAPAMTPGVIQLTGLHVRFAGTPLTATTVVRKARTMALAFVNSISVW